jgi:glycosyltransferase involved in cell wall biosynthesis
LIRVVSELKDKNIHLVIAGEGKLLVPLVKLTESLGVKERVHFAGFLDRKNIWSYYNDADVFMLLSVSEALGLVVWEAMHMRVPVIGTNTGGIKESIGIDGERGFIVTLDSNIYEFEEKLKRCFQLSKNDSMIENAYEYVQIQRKNSKNINNVFEESYL